MQSQRSCSSLPWSLSNNSSDYKWAHWPTKHEQGRFTNTAPSPFQTLSSKRAVANNLKEKINFKNDFLLQRIIWKRAPHIYFELFYCLTQLQETDQFTKQMLLFENSCVFQDITSKLLSCFWQNKRIVCLKKLVQLKKEILCSRVI